MIHIRNFQNRDLPGLFDVWMTHWQAAQQNPPVTISILERAVLSRSFFDPTQLLVAESEGEVVAWCQYFHDEGVSSTGRDSPQGTEKTATLSAICFRGDAGLSACDHLFEEVQRRLAADGVAVLRVGPVRDDRNGYGGLAPIGHGIGIPVSDARTASLLSRQGCQLSRSFERLSVNTATYRPPVKRAFLQLRRQTRVDVQPLLPSEPRQAAAMNHFDVEQHELIDHLKRTRLAQFGLWIGDSEVQVMEGSKAILSFSLCNGHKFDRTLLEEPLNSAGVCADDFELSGEQEFLIATMIASLTHRQIFSVETAVDSEQRKLLTQLKELKFEVIELGRQWEKRLN